MIGTAGSGGGGSSGPAAQSPTAAGVCGVLGPIERIGAGGSLGRPAPGESATAVLKGPKADPAEKVVINSHELWAHQRKGKKREKREEKATLHPQAQQCCRPPEPSEQCGPTDCLSMGENSPRLRSVRGHTVERSCTPERLNDQDGRQASPAEVEANVTQERRRELADEGEGSRANPQTRSTGERRDEPGEETKGKEEQRGRGADEDEREDEEDHEEHEDDDPHEHEVRNLLRCFAGT